MDAVKAARAALGMPVGIMLDTKGPEIRTKTYQDGKIEIVEGRNSPDHPRYRRRQYDRFHHL